MILMPSSLVWSRNSFEIVRYCLKNAPEGCSIVGVDVDVDVDVQALPRKDGDVDSLTYDGGRNLFVGETMSPFLLANHYNFMERCR